jgi:Protein of unknown function (DUF732)
MLPIAGMAGLLLCGLLVAACGATAESKVTQQDFLAVLHQQAPDVGGYRTDSQAVALGQAVCNDLAAGVTVSEISSRLRSSTLPSPDLGAVMSAASQVLCPKYASAFSGGN